MLCMWPIHSSSFCPHFATHFLQDLLKESGLGKHPLTGLDGAGSALVVLRKEFHSFLQTIADIMGKVSGKKGRRGLYE